MNHKKLVEIYISKISKIILIRNQWSITSRLIDAYIYIYGLVKERRNSSALAMELCLSCTELSIYMHQYIIFSDNGLAPALHQAIIRTNADLLSIEPQGPNFDEISTKIQHFSLETMHSNISSGKSKPFCPILHIDGLMQERRNSIANTSVGEKRRTCPAARPKCLMRDSMNLNRIYKGHQTNVWWTMKVFSLHCNALELLLFSTNPSLCQRPVFSRSTCCHKQHSKPVACPKFHHGS